MQEGIDIVREDIEKTADILVGKLKENAWRITTAESCTGGMIAENLVGIAGVSAVFDVGYVTYANEAKVSVLHVPLELIQKYGVVSRQVAEEMARGAAAAAGADTAVAVSGIAGPDGGTKEKPVGTVWIGRFLLGKAEAKEYHFMGSRQEIREQSTLSALRFVLDGFTQYDKEIRAGAKEKHVHIP